MEPLPPPLQKIWSERGGGSMIKDIGRRMLIIITTDQWQSLLRMATKPLLQHRPILSEKLAGEHVHGPC